ncbi:BMP family ABC transporter substrate-binding protein [Pseudooceanicola sp. CBS1P-1]|uniref:BMP family ABC transporter substrate-binding protein n=1 Tax=Pseudooceanicola albus TaxID=2692189 RepID=A0A6L7G2E6_9RHOB|nr:MULTISPECIES: BMP family ABC transporter substrate-binding protein [Pseudooceanicola]MBT9385174.1 BMP family ABC transporter substrate-binding protein [Pseudooceanicola endophyticus]MXN18534.1 BMP family ABC transporter substrate-binding protein [Pseudooceanicola albus]
MISTKELSRRGFLNMGAAAGAGLVLSQTGLIRPAHAAAPLAPVKAEEALIAFGHTGPTSDEGWTWAHDQGMKAVEAAFPGIKTTYVESIPYSADATRIFRQFVSQGANMVFATSNYGDFLYDVAKRAPKVGFYECDGRNPLDNLGTYYVQHWYPTYVAGIAAGAMSPTGKLGYVASFPVPSVYSGTNAFLMGARTVNPNATLQCISINSWFDPQAATQAGTALLDNGCDVLFGIMDEAGYLQVAQDRGKKAVMWNTDLRRYGPDAYISSIVVNFNDFYVKQVGRRLEGSWTPTYELLPMGGGVDRDAWGATVPAEVAAKADAVRTKMMTEGYSPFVGEIKDAKGNIKVAKGQTMTEQELYHWNWSIEGVSGLDG